MRIDYSKSQSAAEAYNKVKSVISSPEFAEKMQVKADVSYDDNDKKIISKGPGFTLTLSFFESHCEADIDLSIILRALKPKIMAKVEDQIKRNV